MASERKIPSFKCEKSSVAEICTNKNHTYDFVFIFMGPCIVRYNGGIYDQQDETNSQYFIVIIALHVSGDHCSSSGARNSSELLMMGNDRPKHVEQL
jgi:hypothetical protein